jgi:hypothetical protein
MVKLDPSSILFIILITWIHVKSKSVKKNNVNELQWLNSFPNENAILKYITQCLGEKKEK